ncbi:leucine-rich melanocyte differentiation-associated protein-like isoform X2 [Phymastichus coffea]|uniref:leucine-rich melanocyte differentiation-associated protein-like isoform X2 n=1 Tax=Phymastichus coffea TaxID=108790 RepID=UPI00273B1DD8|nr:leucine-rich melanocyte differentiation-associated protein-like isoform X2 [Phymastichus coffea]
MAESSEQDFNRSGLTVRRGRAWYTGQRAQRVSSRLVGVVGADCWSLDLSFNELSSLSALKDFPRLRELVLDNNDLKDLSTLPTMVGLSTLSLNNNKISDVDSALERIRQCCPQISYVSILGNPGCPDQLTYPNANDEEDYERYRVYAIHVLPVTLRFLDSRPVTNRERTLANNRGKFFKTVRFDGKSAKSVVPTKPQDVFDEINFHVKYTPLPISVRSPQDHKGAYGKCRYQYSGKNSEGNRFISNNDL